MHFKTIEEWITSHKHSCNTIQADLQQSLDDNPNNLISALEQFKAFMEYLLGDCRREIDDINYWLNHIKKGK